MLQDLIIKPVRYALDHYRRLKDMTKRPSEVRIEQLVSSPEEKEDTQEETKNNSMTDDSNKGGLSCVPNVDHRRASRESLQVESAITNRTRSQQSSVASSRSSLLPQSTDGINSLIDDSEDMLDGITETEVDVMERTSRFKISTEAPITTSQKGSFEKRTSLDGRSSADGKSNYDTNDDLAKRDGLVSLDGRGRDEVGLVGRLYSKEACGDSESKTISDTHIVENELMKNLNEKRSKINKISSTSLDTRSYSTEGLKTGITIATSVSDQDESFIYKFKKLTGSNKKSCIEIPTEEEARKLSVRSNNDELRVSIKRARSKSVADPPTTNRTYSIAKSKINFKSAQNPCARTKMDEAKLLGITSKLHPIVQASLIVERKKNKETSNDNSKLDDVEVDIDDEITNPDLTKHSVSLDMLASGSNDQSNRRDRLSSVNTPSCSEDNLISLRSKQVSAVSSPKTPKKRIDNSRNLIFSLLRRSPTTKENDETQNSL